MKEIGFHRQGRYYHHPDTSYFNELTMETGKIRPLSPTDSVKDRLAAFYHWGDRQSLEQA